MKLSYYFSILIFSIIPFFALSQNTKTLKVDERLFDVYDQGYLETLLTENPFLIKRWNFYLDNAFYITDDVLEKTTDYEVLSVDDIENVNILKLEKEQKIGKSWDLPKVYKIESTSKLLVYYPGKKFNEKLRAHLDKE